MITNPFRKLKTNSPWWLALAVVLVLLGMVVVRQEGVNLPLGKFVIEAQFAPQSGYSQTIKGVTYNFPKGNPRNTPTIVSMIETGRKRVCSLFNCDIPFGTVVNIQSGAVPGLPRSPGATIHTPGTNIYNVIINRSFARGFEKQVMLHETLGHAFCISILCHRTTVTLPRGLDEALSIVISGQGEVEKFMRANLIARQSGQRLSISDLLTPREYPPNLQLFYGSSVALTTYLINKQGGWDKFAQYLRDGVKNGFNEQTFNRNYRMTFRQLQREYENWVSRTSPETAARLLEVELQEVIRKRCPTKPKPTTTYDLEKIYGRDLLQPGAEIPFPPRFRTGDKIDLVFPGGRTVRIIYNEKAPPIYIIKADDLKPPAP